MLVKLIGADDLDKVIDCAFNLVVLGLELLRLFSDPLSLHGDEVIEGESLGILREIDENSLGEGLEVVLNSVLHDVVDVDNQLLELGKTNMHVIQVTIDVHRGPGKGHHSWSKLVLEVLEVRHE